MKYFKTALLSLGLLLQASLSFAAGTVQVHNAWIPEAPPVARVMAAYMVVENTGDKPVTITDIACPAFNGVMMHKTVTKDGMSRMIHMDSLTVAPKSKATFKRGGMHVMLMGPKHSFKVGDKVSLTLKTSDNQTIPFTAVVKPATLGEGQ